MSNKNALIFLIIAICFSFLFLAFLFFLDSGGEKPQADVDLKDFDITEEKAADTADTEEAGDKEETGEGMTENGMPPENSAENGMETNAGDSQPADTATTSPDSIHSPEKQKEIQELKDLLKSL